MIAIESEVALSEIIVFHHEMEVESVGGWKFLYRPKASSKFRFSGLMPVEELEVHLNSIAVPSSRHLSVT